MKMLGGNLLADNFIKRTTCKLGSFNAGELKYALIHVQHGIIVVAENKKAAQSVIEVFHGVKTRIIVQEFIKESKGSDIRAFVVNGEVVGAMKRQATREGEFRSNLHRGGVATLVKLDRHEKHAAIEAAKKMGLGVAGVDMLPSKRGPLIIEVNSSPGMEGIEGATKVDIAGKIYEYVEKHAKKNKIQKDKINA